MTGLMSGKTLFLLEQQNTGVRLTAGYRPGCCQPDDPASHNAVVEHDRAQ
jgi:hypothetical protein